MTQTTEHQVPVLDFTANCWEYVQFGEGSRAIFLEYSVNDGIGKMVLKTARGIELFRSEANEDLKGFWSVVRFFLNNLQRDYASS